MRSPSHAWLWLVRKEWRELLASRAWWVMVALTGPLVGVSFISAVNLYAEASGLGATLPNVGEAFSPLDGIWVPTFTAYELAATFLLPFVVIRLVAGDRQSGALKLELQQGMPATWRILAKVVVLLAGWCMACVPAGIALVLWTRYGGSTYPPELLSVVLGHLLNAGLVIALATAAASVAEHPSTAAILTLAVTVGTWILGFVAAVHGGLWEQVAAYTPGAMLDAFQHGLIRLNAALVVFVLSLTGVGLGAIWLRLGVPVRRRTLESALLGGLAAALVVACALVRPSWDVSENRRHSFARPDQEALARISAPLTIEAHLAPEDPRRFDLEHQALSKLRRAMPSLSVRYVSTTTTGLFEQATAGYGEIRYDLGGRKTTSRLTTGEAVLDTIYGLAGITPPAQVEPAFRGHPLAARPTAAAPIFYAVWPALVAGLALLASRRQT